MLIMAQSAIREMEYGFTFMFIFKLKFATLTEWPLCLFVYIVFEY